jgi:hypothetical protein
MGMATLSRACLEGCVFDITMSPLRVASTFDEFSSILITHQGFHSKKAVFPRNGLARCMVPTDSSRIASKANPRLIAGAAIISSK